MEYFTFLLSYFLHLQYNMIVQTGVTREHFYPLINIFIHLIVYR